jgi:SAM-dependent methyltransferase
VYRTDGSLFSVLRSKFEVRNHRIVCDAQVVANTHFYMATQPITIVHNEDRAADCDEDSSDDEFVAPFMDAFEDGPQAFPFGTMSRVASHVTTLQATTDAAILLSKTNASTVFVDLGCGVGRVVNRVKARFPGARCIGIDMCEGEIDQAIAASNGNGAEYVVDDVLKAENIIGEVEWSNVVIYIFLIPKMVNSRGFKKLLQGFVDKGAKVVSYCYHPENWRIESRDERMNVNLYQGKVF